MLKDKLVLAPIVVAPDWPFPFELMCDASDFAIGAVLEQKQEKIFQVIYYASRTLNDAQFNYATTEKFVTPPTRHPKWMSSGGVTLS